MNSTATHLSSTGFPTDNKALVFPQLQADVRVVRHSEHVGVFRQVQLAIGILLLYSVIIDTRYPLERVQGD